MSGLKLIHVSQRGPWKLIYITKRTVSTLQWRHNECDSVSNHQPQDCLFNCLFRRRSKKTSKLRAIGLCAGNSLVTDEFHAQRASNAENVSIWWRHHDFRRTVDSHSTIRRNHRCSQRTWYLDALIRKCSCYNCYYVEPLKHPIMLLSIITEVKLW